MTVLWLEENLVYTIHVSVDLQRPQLRVSIKLTGLIMATERYLVVTVQEGKGPRNRDHLKVEIDCCVFFL